MDVLASAKQQEALKQTVILVEDDPDNTEMLTFLLEQEGLQTACFQNGNDIFAKLEVVKMLNSVLFLLDYQLPTMTALDLYERLHATDGLEKIPAIIISAIFLDEKQEQRVRQLGLTFLQKPFDIDELLASIQQLIA